MMGVRGGASFQPKTGASSIQPEVFLGRLPPSATQEQILSLCAPHGATDVRMLAGKGCAFATFASFQKAELAIEALNGTCFSELGGEQPMNVKFADVKGAPKNAETEPKVFVGGIREGCTEEYLCQVCAPFGTILNVKIFNKNKSNPCGFVTYTTFAEAEACIQSLHGADTSIAAEGKTLNVKFAEMQQGKLPSPNILGGALAGLYSGMAISPFSSPQMPLSRTVGGGAGGASQKVFVGGLPIDVTEDFLRCMMGPYGDIVEVKILRNGRPCGFVRFATEEQGHLAVSRLGDLQKYVVKWADAEKNSSSMGGSMALKRGFGAAFPHFG